MTLAELLDRLPPTGLADVAFPRRLLGAFRRKSITFCNGLTDEQTVVYWFQSRSFTIDLRLPDGTATPLADRQGWVGDTLWDEERRELSWAVRRSYQPRNQWPEPASFRFIGNSVIEFAPSGAYFEDWRQQASRGPLLGLRLHSLTDEVTGQVIPLEGGLILAGDYVAYAQSRMPSIDDALRRFASLDEALADGTVTAAEIESYDVSVAVGGKAISHSTLSRQLGHSIAAGDFESAGDGVIHFWHPQGRLDFTLDLYVPDFRFDEPTTTTIEASEWLCRETDHLARHAVIAR